MSEKHYVNKHLSSSAAEFSAETGLYHDNLGSTELRRVLPLDICKMFETLGVFNCLQLVSANRIQLARDLYSSSKSNTKQEPHSASSLDQCQSLVESCRAAISKLHDAGHSNLARTSSLEKLNNSGAGSQKLSSIKNVSYCKFAPNGFFPNDAGCHEPNPKRGEAENFKDDLLIAHPPMTQKMQAAMKIAGESGTTINEEGKMHQNGENINRGGGMLENADFGRPRSTLPHTETNRGSSLRESVRKNFMTTSPAKGRGHHTGCRTGGRKRENVNDARNSLSDCFVSSSFPLAKKARFDEMMIDTTRPFHSERMEVITNAEQATHRVHQIIRTKGVATGRVHVTEREADRLESKAYLRAVHREHPSRFATEFQFSSLTIDHVNLSKHNIRNKEATSVPDSSSHRAGGNDVSRWPVEYRPAWEEYMHRLTPGMKQRVSPFDYERTLCQPMLQPRRMANINSSKTSQKTDSGVPFNACSRGLDCKPTSLAFGMPGVHKFGCTFPGKPVEVVTIDDSSDNDESEQREDQKFVDCVGDKNNHVAPGPLVLGAMASLTAFDAQFEDAEEEDTATGHCDRTHLQAASDTPVPDVPNATLISRQACSRAVGKNEENANRQIDSEVDSRENEGVSPPLGEKDNNEKPRKARDTFTKAIKSNCSRAIGKRKVFLDSVLSEFDDLTTILPSKVCYFLGKKLWIFSVQQLDYALSGQTNDDKTNSSSGRKKLDKIGSVMPEQGKTLRETIMQEVINAPNILQGDFWFRVKDGSRDDPEKPGTVLDQTLNEDPEAETHGTLYRTARPAVSIEVTTDKRLLNLQGQTAHDKMGSDLENSKPKDASEIIQKTPEEQPKGIQCALDDSVLFARTGGCYEQSVGSSQQKGIFATTIAAHENEARCKAESLLESWRQEIDDWKKARGSPQQEARLDSQGSPKTSVHSHTRSTNGFRLDGPVSVLFPQYLLSFFASISVETAHHFFSIKKTESSNLVRSLLEWREKLKLEPLKPIALSRYLLGLSSRVQAALTSIPPADVRTRQWMGSPLVVLSGSARSFICLEGGTTSVEDFVETKTKDLAEQLSRWRESKGLAPLKGSGSVATISGWKTSVKEAEIAENRILISLAPKLESSMATTKAQTLSGVSVSSAAPDNPRKTSSSLSLSQIETSDDAETICHENVPNSSCETDLGSDPFTSPSLLCKVLKSSHVDFLSSVGITNAQQLVSVSKRVSSPAVLAMVDYRSRQGQKNIQVSSCVRNLYEWTQKVKDEIERMGGMDHRKFPAKRRGRPRGKKNCTKLTETENKVLIRDENENSTDESSETEDDGKVTCSPDHSRDPLRLLSKMAKKFLASQGVTKAEQLLSTKSSILAEAYIKWRSEQDMTTLKGYGASASVSGWKSSVKEAARGLGLDELLRIRAPAGRNKNPGKQSNLCQQPDCIIAESCPSDFQEIMSHPNVLSGLPSRKFTVCSVDGGTMYDFKLSVRRSGITRSSCPSGDLGLYLSYLGARTGKRDAHFPDFTPGKKPHLWNSAVREDGISVLPILFERTSVTQLPGSKETYPVDFIPFSSGSLNCGVLEVSRFVGDFPIRTNATVADRREQISEDIKNFILCENCVPLALTDGSSLATTKRDKDFEMGEVNVRSNPPKRQGTEEENDVDPAYQSHTSNGGNGIFFLRTNREGRRECLIYVADLMEKGQTLELSLGGHLGSETESILSKTADTGGYRMHRNICQRTKIEQTISSLSLDEMRVLVQFINDSLRAPMETKLAEFLDSSNREMDANESAESSDEGITATSRLLLSRRRLHWVAQSVQRQMDALLMEAEEQKCKPPFLSETEQKRIKKKLIKMQWDTDLCDLSDFFLAWNDGIVFDILQQEVSEEILTALSMKETLKLPFDESSWCPLSSGLLRDLLDHYSAYLLMNFKTTVSSQRELVETMVQCALKAITRFFEISRALASNTNPAMAYEIAFCSSSQSRNIDAIGRHLHDVESCISSASWLPKNIAEVPMDLAAHVFDIKAYEDSLELCDESPFGLNQLSFMARNEECVTIAVEAPWCSAAAQHQQDGVVARNLSAIKATRLFPSKEWYIGNQILRVVCALGTSGVIKWITASGSYREDDVPPLTTRGVFDSILRVAKGSIRDIDLRYELVEPYCQKHPCHVHLSIKQLVGNKNARVQLAPNSLPIFLKFFWPCLNKIYGWRLEAGRQASQISFSRPDARFKKRRRVNNAENSRIHDERTQKKVKISEYDVRTQLPLFPRALKFILGESLRTGNAPTNMTVKKFLDKYVQKIGSQFHGIHKYAAMAQEITTGIMSYFDAVLPSLLTQEEEKPFNAGKDDRRNCESYGCEYLLRLFMSLPYMMVESEVEENQRKTVLIFIDDMIKFMSSNYAEIFDEVYHPPFELYDDVQSEFCSCLSGAFGYSSNQPTVGFVCPTTAASPIKLGSREIDDSESPQELVRPEDRKLLTDFTFLVMSQVLPYRAAPTDVKKGKRKGTLRLGYPGIACRHCLSITDEANRYFFGSKESLATSAATVSSHLQKCGSCPNTIKDQLKSLKMRHGEQRKALRHGSQSTFYSRLWQRLFSWKGGTALAEQPLVEQKSAHSPEYSSDRGEQAEDDVAADYWDDPPNIAFQSHVELIAYLGQTEPWNQKADLLECFQKYYACLCRGGELWNTPEMPVHFSSEWLLGDNQLK